MSRLAAILQRHANTEYFNSKILQQAGRFDSRQSAYNLMHGGSESFERICDLIHRLPLPVALDCLNVLAGGLPVAVVARERCDGSLPPGLRAVGLTEGAATFTRMLFEGLADNHLTTTEFDALKLEYEGQQRGWAMLWDAIEKRKPRAA